MIGYENRTRFGESYFCAADMPVFCCKSPHRHSRIVIEEKYPYSLQWEETQVWIKAISGNDIKICRVMQKKPHGIAWHIFIECYYNKKRHAALAR